MILVSLEAGLLACVELETRRARLRQKQKPEHDTQSSPVELASSQSLSLAQVRQGEWQPKDDYDRSARKVMMILDLPARTGLHWTGLAGWLMAGLLLGLAEGATCGAPKRPLAASIQVQERPESD